MLVLTQSQVEALLDPDALVEALRVAMADLSRGGADMPPRQTVSVDGGTVYVMPAYLPEPAGALTTKLVSVFPGNHALGLDSHLAVILALDPATGAPAALLDGTAITAARTAAGSALATSLLARDPTPDAPYVLAILGTGVQARAHAHAVTRVRDVTEVRVAGRDPAKATALAAELDAALPIPVAPVQTWQEALAGADVVCATTHSPAPVVRREWLTPGVHVNSVGLNPDGRELDGRTVADALVVVESRAAALAPAPAGANDLTWPLRDGLITEDHLHAEVGELILGTRPGRTDPDQLTLYKSVGVGVQDAAAAALVLRRAAEQDLGTRITLQP